MPSSDQPTPFMESNALLAIVREDEDAANDILKGMLAYGLLASMARCEARAKRDAERTEP